MDKNEDRLDYVIEYEKITEKFVSAINGQNQSVTIAQSPFYMDILDNLEIPVKSHTHSGLIRTVKQEK